MDYVAFGPIFKTATKENPDPVAGLVALREVRGTVGSLPLVAIGGITLSNALEAIKAGADTLAIISGLVGQPGEIAENMSKMLALTSSLVRNSCSG